MNGHYIVNIITFLLSDNFNNNMRNSYTILELPPNYAQLLLDRQIAVRLSVQPLQENLCALLQLYSKGFEYYQSLGSFKYKFFDLKMRQIFLSQEKEAKSLHNLNLSVNEQTQLQDKMAKQSKKLVSQKIKYLSCVELQTRNTTNQQSLQKLLLLGQQKLLEANMRIKHEIDFQNRLLQRKLQERSQRVLKLRQRATNLKYNSTKTSLLSQSSQQKYVSERLIDHIFQDELREHEEEFGQKQIQSCQLASPQHQCQVIKN